MFVIKRHITAFRNCKMTVNRTPAELTYAISRTYTDQAGNTYTYNFINEKYTLSDLAARPDFTDYVTYGLYIRETNLSNLDVIAQLFDQAIEYKWLAADLKSKISELFTYAFNTKPLNAVHFVNITAMTLPTRNSLGGLRNVMSGTRLIQLFIPFKDCPFTKMAMSIAAYPGMDITSSEEIVSIQKDKLTEDETVLSWLKANGGLPAFKLDGPEAIAVDDKVTLLLSLVNTFDGTSYKDKKVTAYVELVNGYCPYSRIEVTGNEATSIPVRALDMTAGDTIKLKVGFKYYPGVTEHTCTVIKK